MKRNSLLEDMITDMHFFVSLFDIYLILIFLILYLSYHFLVRLSINDNQVPSKDIIVFGHSLFNHILMRFRNDAFYNHFFFSSIRHIKDQNKFCLTEIQNKLNKT